MAERYLLFDKLLLFLHFLNNLIGFDRLTSLLGFLNEFEGFLVVMLDLASDNLLWFRSWNKFQVKLNLPLARWEKNDTLKV